MGHAKLMGKVKVGAMTSLGALILNDNAMTSISGMQCTLKSCDLDMILEMHNCACRSALLNLLCIVQEGMARITT